MGTNVLEWRKNEFGDEDSALYWGPVFCGGVDKISRLSGLKPWRAWIMNDSDGSLVGRFETKEEAKKALENAVGT